MLFGLAIGLDLLGVLLEIDRETGVAGGIADKVKVVGLGGVHRGAQGCQAGVGDWPGRRAGVFVGVVGRGRLQVRGVDGAAPAVVEQGGVNDGWVGGQGHGFSEAVDEDPGYEGPLGVLTYLFFNEGGQDDGLGHVGLADTELRALLAEAVNHRGEDLKRCGVAGEAVGVGKEVAFEGFGVGVRG